ncbi:MAG: primase, partial [Nocardioidaceae bacterium]|nr:primase [Nocardioidaceae bacterium]
LYDWFRGRLLWPIRETNSDVVGFGARRIFDDDRIEAKYINTGESPIYKKSQVLYGIDLARRDMARSSQAVVVEGYTDVMACHLAGVGSAVATCGTAFGADQAAALNRLLHSDGGQGEVVFTFDGDAAGQSAALKVFALDEKFGTPTYVAVEKSGMDPCEVRLDRGDAAVRDLIASRVPLNLFVLDNIVTKYDLERGDQRIDAIRDALGLLSSVRDRSKTESFNRDNARRVGVTPEEVKAEVPKARTKTVTRTRPTPEEVAEPAAQRSPEPSLGEPRFTVEREALMAIVQYPHLARDLIADIDVFDFHHRLTQEVWEAIAAHELPTRPDQSWISHVAESLPNDESRRVLAQSVVEQLQIKGNVTAADVSSLIGRLHLQTVERRIAEIKSRLQRTNPVTELDAYNRMFGELIEIEQKRRVLRERVFGEQ